MAAADAIWAEQERAKDGLRAAGVGKDTRGLGSVHPAKGELVRRLTEQAADGRGLDVAMADCRHVLEVLLAEAKASGQLRWLDGGHWEPKRFAAALSQSPEAARRRAKERRAAGAPGAAPPASSAYENPEKPINLSADELAASAAHFAELMRAGAAGGGQ